MTERSGRLGEFLRFFAVTVLGLAVDLGLGWAVIAGAGAGDLAAAGLGLAAGMVVNYLLHLRWTFRDHGRQAGPGHFLAFALLSGVTLAIRLGVLSGLGWLGLREWLHPLVRLGIAAGLSFVVGYLLSRTLIFRRRAVDQGERAGPTGPSPAP